MLEDIFKEFGLGSSEAKVYLQLLESGPMSAGHLARILAYPRSSLYGLLDTLAGKGLVLQSKKHDTKIWQAAPPEKILSLVDDKMLFLGKKRTDAEVLVHELVAQNTQDITAPRFHYFEGVEGVQQILKDILLYRDIATQAFWPIEDMVEVLGADFFHVFNIQRIQNNIFTQAIWPADKAIAIAGHPFLGVGKEFKREIRIAPKGISITMGYWAYENKVAFLSSKREGFGFIVESKELRDMLKSQFDVLWHLSKPIQDDKKITSAFLKENNLI